MEKVALLSTRPGDPRCRGIDCRGGAVRLLASFKFLPGGGSPYVQPPNVGLTVREVGNPCLIFFPPNLFLGFPPRVFLVHRVPGTHIACRGAYNGPRRYFVPDTRIIPEHCRCQYATLIPVPLEWQFAMVESRVKHDVHEVAKVY